VRFPFAAATAAANLVVVAATAATLDLSKSTIVVSGAEAGTAATVLAEEVGKRSGIRLSSAPAAAAIQIRIGVQSSGVAEGFSLSTSPNSVTLEGNDRRGILYAVGYLLRNATLEKGRFAIDDSLRIRSSPRYPIRGHQLGYRNTANSWDAWTVQQFDQYIRELALFGVNAIENIPFQDDRKNPLMKVDRREMNRAMAGICRKYGLDYWVWTPATVDLADRSERAQLLSRFDQLFADVPDVAGVFVPGGDPGNNPPELLLPFLEEISKRTKAKVWVSMQGFHGPKEEAVYSWMNSGAAGRPWFGGIVAGPSSPNPAHTRLRLPAGAGLRLYPDLTHNKISQFEVPQWDQAYALTLGREAINPRPYEYAAIFQKIAPLSSGFISYSDGVHDDVNKVVWSALAWDPSMDVRRILIEYCRFHFGAAVAVDAADGLLALERNWRGPLLGNGGVEATLAFWNALEKRAGSNNSGNWRWQMCLLRANYDAYLRRRLIQAVALERDANRLLAQAGAGMSADAAMLAVEEVLGRAPAAMDLRSRIVDLCEQLFQSVGLQTSVEKYHASGAERGAVLDFVDHPLNNRWWLEDEFAKVRKMADEAAKVARLREIAAWESPGPGSFYDAVGDINKSPNAAQAPGGILGGNHDDDDSDPLFWWWDSGKSRARLSWQVTRWPANLTYDGLDPKATYVVRTQGYGQCLLRVDGERVQPTVDGREMHEFKEFPVPANAISDGKLVLTFDKVTDESHLNWRRRSRLAEVWLIRRGTR